MSFEYRKIIDNEGDMELSILSESNNFDMLSLSIKSKDIFYDNEVWLKFTLLPALQGFVYRSLTDEQENELDFIPKEQDRIALYEMFVRAEASGWLYNIKNS